MPYCPECGGEMKYVSTTRCHVCKSCGLSLNRQELMEMRKEMGPDRRTDSDEGEERKRDYIKWWLSKKK